MVNSFHQSGAQAAANMSTLSYWLMSIVYIRAPAIFLLLILRFDEFAMADITALYIQKTVSLP